MENRTPVHEDLAAERAVLGAVLADNKVLTDVAQVVLSGDFALPAHQHIFNAMLELDKRQAQIDHLTLAEELKTQGLLAQVGGPTYLVTLDQMVPLAQNAAEYASIVKDKATRRALAAAGRQILELASAETGQLDELLDESQ